jgi:hypothetical protein
MSPAQKTPEQAKEVARQYFMDLAAEGRPNCPRNLQGWLWFTCPASMRTEVLAVIKDMRK